MKFPIAICIALLVGRIDCENKRLREIFSWKVMDYAWDKPEDREAAIASKEFIPSNNLILGLDRWKNKLFLTVPRWKAGVVSTLNYINISVATPTTEPPPPPTSPVLIPYPSFEANRLIPGRDPNAPTPIASVFRVRVDPCDRLWVMDSGVADILGKPEVVTKARILIYDLNTDKLIREYKLKDTDTGENSFFANIIVDVTADACDKAFAYLPDLGAYGIVVYDFANNNSYKLTHNYFHFDPLAGNMVVGGQNFQWTDGIFSIALTKPDDNGVRDAYFHPLASTKEFKVKTDVLQNEDSKGNFHEYKLVGDRGENSQSSASFIHEETGVMFYTQLQKDSVNCWNTNKKLIPENIAEVASDNETMIFTNDLKVDADSNLWVLTDKLPIFIYSKLDDDEVNYRIFTAPVKDAITGTSCAP